MQHRNPDTERAYTLSKNIDVFINRSGLTYKQVADHLHITIKQLERYRQNKSEPKAILLFHLADLLEVDILRLFMTESEWMSHLDEIYL